MSRILRHVALAVVAVAVSYFVFSVLDSTDALFRISMGTAYASLLFLTVTLGIGPWNVMRGNSNPISTYVRRDFGIWTAIIATVHVIVGLQVHLRGKMWLYFVYRAGEAHWIPLRHDPFGFANYTGLAAGLMLLVLMAISNNVSLRYLGAARWKFLQRWNYAIAILTILHGATYQLLEKRQLGYVAIYAGIIVAMLAIQLTGFRQLKYRAHS